MSDRVIVDRVIVAHRETIHDKPRVRIGIGDYLALSLSVGEAVELYIQLRRLLDAGPVDALLDADQHREPYE